MAVLLWLLTPLHVINDLILRITRRVAGAALVVMVGVILVQVFYRYVLGNALSWPAEAARFMMLWMTGLAAPVAYRRGGFVAIDMLEEALPRRVADVLNLALLVMGVAVLVFALRLGIDHVESGWLFNSSSLKLPVQLIGFDKAIRLKLGWMYMSLYAGVILLLIVNVELLLRQIITILGARDRLPRLKALDLPEAE